MRHIKKAEDKTLEKQRKKIYRAHKLPLYEGN